MQDPPLTAVANSQFRPLTLAGVTTACNILAVNDERLALAAGAPKKHVRPKGLYSSIPCHKQSLSWNPQSLMQQLPCGIGGTVLERSKGRVAF